MASHTPTQTPASSSTSLSPKSIPASNHLYNIPSLENDAANFQTLLCFRNSCQLHLCLCLSCDISVNKLCSEMHDSWLPYVSSSSLCSLGHSSETLRATLQSYLMSILFGHHQWISTWTLYSTFQPLTLRFRVQACTERSSIFITCLFHVSEFTCSYNLSICLS